MLNPSFCVPYSPQNPPVLLTLKSVCLAWGQPLSSVSGRKRYNTLDLQAKSCANRDASRPYWKPRAEGLHPSGHLHIFLENGTQTVKMQFDTFPKKI